MIGLVEYIKNKNTYQFIENFDDYISINGISENSLDWYANNVWDNDGYYRNNRVVFSEEKQYSPLDRINEMLNSVTIDRLLKELNKSLAKGKLAIIVDKEVEKDYNKEDIKAKQLIVPKEIFDKNKIEDICNKMMWTLSSIYMCNKFGQGQFLSSNLDNEVCFIKDKKKEYTFIVVEPIKSEVVTDYVKKECGDKVYHICKKKTYEESIKRTGLRLKGENNGYRFIKNKVYFCCGKTEEEYKKALIEVAKSKRIWINNKLQDDYIVLEIDTSKYNIDFYVDTYYDNKNIIYTYAYFPPSRIEIYDKPL